MRFEKWLILALWLLAPLAAKAQTPVSVQALSEVLVDLDRRAPADVRPLNDAVIAAEVTAVVSTVHADVGQVVAGKFGVSVKIHLQANQPQIIFTPTLIN
jgi:hypothetical protein